MRKYIYIYKSTLIENLTYVANILFGFVSFFSIMFIFLNLWQYVYSDGSELINGYSFEQMIWYVLITEMLWHGTRNRAFSKEISDTIKTGNIAYNINKPYNYVIYVLFKHLGEITIKCIITSIVGIIIGLTFIGPIENFSFINLPLILLAFFLGTLINSIIVITISICSFWIEDSSPFYWVYNKIMLLLGTLFPIEMFPEAIRPIISCSPIFVVTYGPAKLVLNFSIEMFIKIFIAQIIYLLVLFFIMNFLYNKGVKKLNVNGG